MTQELLYTSAPRGLKPGSRGFCTVVSTRGLSAPLAAALESLSGYRPIFPPGHPDSHRNPLVFSHVTTSAGGQSHHVLSRISDFGLDYSGRGNKLAHHVVVAGKELTAAGPAWLLSRPEFMQSKWDGTPGLLDAGRRVPAGESHPGVCRAWADLTGDAGWAGVLAESFLSAPDRPVHLIFSPGMDLLPLFAEAIALLPPERRWAATFTTYSTNLPPGVTCAWRGLLKDSAEAKQARRQVNALRLDLSQPLGEATGSKLVELARTGMIAGTRPAPSAADADAAPPAWFGRGGPSSAGTSPPPVPVGVEDDGDDAPYRLASPGPPRPPVPRTARPPRDRRRLEDLYADEAHRRSRRWKIVLFTVLGLLLLVPLGWGGYLLFRGGSAVAKQGATLARNAKEHSEKIHEAAGGTRPHQAESASDRKPARDRDGGEGENRRAQAAPSEKPSADTAVAQARDERDGGHGQLASTDEIGSRTGDGQPVDESNPDGGTPHAEDPETKTLANAEKEGQTAGEQSAAAGELGSDALHYIEFPRKSTHSDNRQQRADLPGVVLGPRRNENPEKEETNLPLHLLVPSNVSSERISTSVGGDVVTVSVDDRMGGTIEPFKGDGEGNQVALCWRGPKQLPDNLTPLRWCVLRVTDETSTRHYAIGAPRPAVCTDCKFELRNEDTIGWDDSFPIPTELDRAPGLRISQVRLHFGEESYDFTTDDDPVVAPESKPKQLILRCKKFATLVESLPRPASSPQSPPEPVLKVTFGSEEMEGRVHMKVQFLLNGLDVRRPLGGLEKDARDAETDLNAKKDLHKKKPNDPVIVQAQKDFDEVKGRHQVLKTFEENKKSCRIGSARVFYEVFDPNDDSVRKEIELLRLE